MRHAPALAFPGAKIRIPVLCVSTSHGDPIAGKRRQRWFESTERSCLRSCPRRTGPTQVHRQGDATVMASDLTTCDLGRTPDRALPTASCEKTPSAETRPANARRICDCCLHHAIGESLTRLTERRADVRTSPAESPCVSGNACCLDPVHARSVWVEFVSHATLRRRYA